MNHNTKRLHDQLELYQKANNQQMRTIEKLRRQVSKHQDRGDAWERHAKAADEALQNAVAEIETLREYLSFSDEVDQ